MDSLDHLFKQIVQDFIGIALFNAPGTYIQSNERFSKMLGFKHAELLHLTFLDLIHPDERASAHQDFESLLQKQCGQRHIERRFIRKDKGILWADLFMAIPDGNSSPNGIICMMTDITERKWTEEAEHLVRINSEDLNIDLQETVLREQQINEIIEFISGNLDTTVILQNVARLATQAVNASTGALLYFGKERSLDGLFLYNSPGKTVFTPFAGKDDPLRQEMETGKPLFLPHIGLIHPTDEEEEKARLVKLVPKLQSAGVHSLIAVPITAWKELLGSLALFSLTPDVIFSERDLTLAQSVGRGAGIAIKNAKLYEEVQRLAVRDPLTGIFNRRYFFDLVQSEIIRSQRYQTPMSLIMLDIDHFKRVNDTYGHQIGDEVLKVVAQRCCQTLRTADWIARYGGEEFIFLFPETPLEGARQAAERLCRVIAASSIQVQDALVFITASLGVTGVENATPATTPESLLIQADQALYCAKQNGRNQVAVWEQSLLGNVE